MKDITPAAIDTRFARRALGGSRVFALWQVGEDVHLVQQCRELRDTNSREIETVEDELTGKPPDGYLRSGLFARSINRSSRR